MHLQQWNDFKRLQALHRTGSVSTDFIASYFDMSSGHVRRLLREGKEPGNHTSWNRIQDEVREFVVEAAQDQPHLNCQWLSEMVSDRFARPVSRSSVWRILKAEGLLTDRELSTPVLRRRFEASASGELVQMDTTWGYWLGGERLYLTVMLDDHSRMLLASRFSLEETLWHNMTLIREAVEQHGMFKVLYTDNAVWFKAIRHNRSVYQTHRQGEYESQIGRACRELGIVHVTHKPYEPQGKGKVERFFRFVQERFISQIVEDTVPLWLINKKFGEWADWYNTHHVNRSIGCPPQKRFDPIGFKPLCVTERQKLDDIFCIRETRVVDKCNRFSFQGASYEIPGSRSLAHRTLTVHVHPGVKIRVWHGSTFVCELPIR